jgi:hypothetical protein
MTGFIGVGQLRYILTNLGEKMSDEEVDELLKAVDTSSGEINYTGNFPYHGKGGEANRRQISSARSWQTKSLLFFSSLLWQTRQDDDMFRAYFTVRHTSKQAYIHGMVRAVIRGGWRL